VWRFLIKGGSVAVPVGGSTFRRADTALYEFKTRGELQSSVIGVAARYVKIRCVIMIRELSAPLPPGSISTKASVKSLPAASSEGPR
jgi:hypothetical protein